MTPLVTPGKAAYVGAFPTMPRVFIKTYGCQMNVRDSEQVAQMFEERGYTMTPQETEADVILINTCSVRDQAEQKALGKMGNMGKYREKTPHLVYGFMGCMAQSRGPELLKNVPHTDLVVGTLMSTLIPQLTDAKIPERSRDLLLKALEVALPPDQTATHRLPFWA